MCGCRQAGMEDLTQEKVLRFAAEHENASLALVFRIRYTQYCTRECLREAVVIAFARIVPTSPELSRKGPFSYKAEAEDSGEPQQLLASTRCCSLRSDRHSVACVSGLKCKAKHSCRTREP